MGALRGKVKKTHKTLTIAQSSNEMQKFTISDLVLFVFYRSEVEHKGRSSEGPVHQICPCPLYNPVLALSSQASHLLDSTSKTSCSLKVTVQIGFKNSCGFTPAGI